MIRTSLRIDYKGKIFDVIAKGRVDIEDFFASIEFPAPYAIYAFEAHGRNIRYTATQRNRAQIIANFEKNYDQHLSVTRALNYARTELLKSIRDYELNAPAPPPPAINPFSDRLRRITGRLSDTATRPGIRQQGALPSVRDPVGTLTASQKANIVRRRSRSGGVGIGAFRYSR